MFSFDQAEPIQHQASQQSTEQQEQNPDITRPKRPRSSLACIRCRKKKVKCDFIQPTCGRCSAARLPCSYAAPPRRVDGQAFDQLGNHVNDLKKRMQKMQSELNMMKPRLNPFAAGDFLGGPTIHRSPFEGTHPTAVSPSTLSQTVFESQQQPQQQQLVSTTQPVTWKLSLSPSGLRIDTNIASVADLYRILLNGISQLNISGDSATSLFSMDSLKRTSSTGDTAGINKSRSTSPWGRYAKYRAFGNRNNSASSEMVTSDKSDALVTTTSMKSKTTITAGTSPSNVSNAASSPSSTPSSPGRLWEVNEKEARMILQEKQPDDTMKQETLDQLVSGTYHSCFLAYQIVDQKTFINQYNNDQSGLDPLLVNSINAWLSKHGCVYHGACPDKDPSTMGETYFKNARQLLKKCFDISSPNTIHALINLYMYQLSCERSSLAYLYIGLAIRMAQDLKFHKKEFMPADPVLKEANKRLWWTAYWLDLCAALESNRPTMVDDKDCDLEYPVKLPCEDDETGYRIGFAVYSIKLMKVRKDITKHLPSEQSGQSLLSAISRLENALTSWLQDLPIDLRLEADEQFAATGSFRDEACLVLNIQYQTTWIMLHKFFLPKKDQTATPVALLSLNICTKSANFITKMLDIYRRNLPWCQFFYALDGVIASVTIHQVNAMSTEEEVAVLAQRNLIVTADILRQSPLIYMDRVNEIVESVEGFLKDNNLATKLQDLPMVNEESISQQCLSSVFHPTVFDQSEITTSSSVGSISNNSANNINHNNNPSNSVKNNMFGNMASTNSNGNSSISTNASTSSNNYYLPVSPSPTGYRSHRTSQYHHESTFGTPSSIATAAISSSSSSSSVSSFSGTPARTIPQQQQQHQHHLHNQQYNNSPLSISTSPFMSISETQYGHTASVPIPSSPSINLQHRQQQQQPATHIPATISDSDLMFGNDIFNDQAMMNYSNNSLTSMLSTSLGNTSNAGTGDHFIFGADMQFVQPTPQADHQLHRGDMFDQLGTSMIHLDHHDKLTSNIHTPSQSSVVGGHPLAYRASAAASASSSSNIGNNSLPMANQSHHDVATILNMPSHDFLMNEPSSGNEYGVSSVYQQHTSGDSHRNSLSVPANISSSLSSSSSINGAPLSSSSSSSVGVFSNMDTGALHDILYGNTVAQQQQIINSGTASMHQHAQGNSETNTTDAFHFGSHSSAQGYMNESVASLFSAMNGEMNTGQKRVHREWDGAS